MVALLLAAFAALSFSASLKKGVSFDEGLQLAMGYNVWTHADFRFEGANGDLVKRWATLPYLFTQPNFLSQDDSRWQQLEAYDAGRRFLFELGNQPEMLLLQGRSMILVLGVMTGLLVFTQARALFGDWAGLVSLLVFVTSPHLLVFSAIVSTDLSITLALFGSSILIWELLHRITVLRLALSLMAVAMLVLAKMSWVVILPEAGLLVALRLIRGLPLHVTLARRTWQVNSRRRQLAVFGALLGMHAVVGWTAIWAHYDFRYAADPRQDAPVIESVNPATGAADGIDALVSWVSREHLLPEGYCRGVGYLLSTLDNNPAFMAGETKHGGWPAFFPFAIWVKTQPALFGLLLLGVVSFWLKARQQETNGHSSVRARWGSSLYPLAPHVALIAVYLGAAMVEDINIGHRHVLPIYPSLFVLAGAAVGMSPFRTRWFGGSAALLLVWRAVEIIGIWPNYLAYFAPQVGGPAKGYTLLVDSSLDWGMNLPSLKSWLDRNNPGNREPLFFAYFGTDSVPHHGIDCVRLPGFHPALESPHAYLPGIYAISATLFQGRYLPVSGRWNALYEKIYQSKFRRMRELEAAQTDPARQAKLLRKKPADWWGREYRTYDYFRFGRLCAWLRQHGDPPQLVGHTILIWRLSRADLEAALTGPLSENDDVPKDWLKNLGVAPASSAEDVQIHLGDTGKGLFNQ